MDTSERKCAFVVGLVAVLVISLALPGQAAYTKLYSFYNTTGTYQSSVQATTMGLELITRQYVFPGAWAPASMSYGISGGVYGTRITADGPAQPPNANVKLGWTTSDGSCRLRDLRWGGGQVIVPTQLSGVTGGGMVFYDHPDPGCLTMVITNDNLEPDQVITVSDFEFAISGYELSLEELEGLLDAGLVELRVARIDDDIDVLRAEVAYHDSLGELPSPSATGLDKKLARAAAYKHQGLAAYLEDDLGKALFLWDKAAHQVENFVDQVTAMSLQGNLAEYLYQRWVVDGGGEIAPAPEIEAALLALPEGQPLQSLEPLPCGELPAYPGLDPANCVEWPVDELYPGQYTAFFLCNVDLGSGFIIGGSLVDGDGNVVLDWLEQSVAEPAPLDITPPEITGATATPAELWPPDHSIVQMTLEVTVEDDSYAVWYIAGVASNQPQDGLGDGDYAPDWGLDPDDPQSVWLRAERSGNDPTVTRKYTITLMAIDVAGNLSQPWELFVEVDHDMQDAE